MSLSKCVKTAIFSVLVLSSTAMASTHSFPTFESDKRPQAVRFAEANQQATVTKGVFEGRSKHITAGDVSILKTRAGYALVFSDNFFLDGAPDPIIGFGNNGKYDPSSKLAKLESETGRQVYPLPAGFTPTDFNEVYVWCEKFSLPLGVAKLNAGNTNDKA